MTKSTRRLTAIIATLCIAAALVWLLSHRFLSGSEPPITSKIASAPSSPALPSPEKAQGISVNVVDDKSNAPVAHAQVAIFAPGPLPDDWFDAGEWQTNEKGPGAFEIPAGQLRLGATIAARAEGFFPDLYVLDAARFTSNLSEVVIRLHKKRAAAALADIHAHGPSVAPSTAPPDRADKDDGVIEGTVTISGEAPKQVFVEVSVETEAGTWRPVRVPQAVGGEYRAEGLPAGTVRLAFDATAKDDAHRSRTETITLRAHERRRLDVDFGVPSALTGRVTGLREDEAGGILALRGQFDIQAFTMDEVYQLAEDAGEECRVRKDGTFRLADLDPGVYTVIALAQASMEKEEAEGVALRYVTQVVTLEPGQETSLELSFVPEAH